MGGYQYPFAFFYDLTQFVMALCKWMVGQIQSSQMHATKGANGFVLKTVLWLNVADFMDRR